MKGDLYAVVTGDIVGSSTLSPAERERLYHSLQSVTRSIHEHYSDLMPYAPSIFSGDSWQLVASNPGSALRIALHLRALIISSSRDQRIDTRLAIGVGKIDFIPKDDISGGDGEAYRLSGQGLERIRKQERMAVAFPDAVRSILTEAVHIIVRMVDLRVSDWTTPQATAVTGVLLERTQQKIAADWPEKPITQQAVAQHLKNAAWDCVVESVVFFENAVESILKEH